MKSRLMTLYKNSDGVPYLATGSPHAVGPRRAWLHRAIRPELSALHIESASPVFRTIPNGEPYPRPETCLPYRAATGLGFMLRSRLLLLFVKTRDGVLLPDARTALAYARENEAQFADVLSVIERRAAGVLKPKVVRRYERDAPLLFRDLVQPYSTFAEGFFDIPAGFYCVTAPGIGTVIGPPINRPSLLPVQSGLIETEWHHHGLFVVIRYPKFHGQSLLIATEQDLAQVCFVALEEASSVSVEHSTVEAGGERTYEATWKALSAQLAQEGKGVVATRTGVASVTLECLHCRMSVTSAAESRLPQDHKLTKVFVPPYKVMRRRNQIRRNRS